jgi:Na+-transporting methylmalonyl-CoA/oxaloacetate decarboxylase beta subunit
MVAAAQAANKTIHGILIFMREKEERVFLPASAWSAYSAVQLPVPLEPPIHQPLNTRNTRNMQSTEIRERIYR